MLCSNKPCTWNVEAKERTPPVRSTGSPSRTQLLSPRDQAGFRARSNQPISCGMIDYSIAECLAHWHGRSSPGSRGLREGGGGGGEALTRQNHNLAPDLLLCHAPARLIHPCMSEFARSSDRETDSAVSSTKQPAQNQSDLKPDPKPRQTGGQLVL